MKNKIKAILSLLVGSIYLLPKLASAHENYVLTQPEINADLGVKGLNVFSALNNPGNLRVAATVGLLSLVAIVLYFFFDHSRIGQKFNDFVGKAEPFGHVVLRVVLAASLIASAHFSSFLGPEIPIASIPIGLPLKYVMYILGVMMALGIWVELTGLASLVILLLATWVYKDYMLTYFNYFGEFIALALLGSRIFSLDRLWYGAKKIANKYHEWEIALIRVTYGISIMYPAITYKLQHPEVIVDIVNRYHMNQIHWLFPSDPLLISLGTGLAQILVGLCLVFGFETRLNTLITFILLVMSITFFKEAVWPHYILLALCLYLMINNGGKLSLDTYIEKNKAKLKRIFFKKSATN